MWGRDVYDRVDEDDRPELSSTAAGGTGQRVEVDQKRLDAVDLPFEFVSVGSGPDQCSGFIAQLPVEPFLTEGPTADDPEQGHQAGAVKISDDAAIMFLCLGRLKEGESLQQSVDEIFAVSIAETTEPKPSWSYSKPVPESRKNLNGVIRLVAEMDTRLLIDRYFA